MKHNYTLLLFALFALFGHLRTRAQCPPGQSQVVVTIIPDNYPQETSWELRNVQTNTVIASGGAVGQTVCVPDNVCIKFTIFDSYGDGICCSYGNGSYTVKLNGSIVATGGHFTSQESTYFNCPPGYSCNSAININTGSYATATNEYWYTYTPTLTGTYEISTCTTNTCNTKIWVYDHCVGLIYDNSNAGTVFYDDNAGGCGLQARVTAYLAANTTYYIRIGTVNGSCANTINWSLNYLGPVTGCMDVNACNYNPLATVAGSCIYPGDPACPNAPDLMVMESVIRSSLQMSHINSTDGCLINEGCLSGYGLREILRFTTHIKNIGQEDYYIGQPSSGNPQFTFDNCHNHWHYQGYAQYLLYDFAGHSVPVGYKNGFCVLDLECSGGGSGRYGCGNMGISSGCGDIYDSGLMCQWVDMTDIDTGSYVLVVKVNWDQSPDALGRVESSYENNYGKACIRFKRDQSGNPSFVLLPDCPDIIDCNGTPFGNAQADCSGNCGGVLLHGDMNGDTLQQTQDAQLYIQGILTHSVPVSSCKDLNNDGQISLFDAALINNCALHGQSFNDLCTFPRGLLNINDTVTLAISDVSMAGHYVDISVRNPSRKLLGYQFKMSGLQIVGVQNMADPTLFPVTPQFLPNGNEVIALSYQENLLPKNITATPLCRVFFSQLTDSAICIQEVVDVVNENYQQTVKAIGGSCFQFAFAGIVQEQKIQFKVFPNPANEQVTVSFLSNKSADLLVDWVDATGRLVLSDSKPSYHGGSLSYDVQNFASGIYMIRLRYGQQSSIHKVIVQHNQ